MPTESSPPTRSPLATRSPLPACSPSPTNSANMLNALGPGILFAATSVGVSHLVQSTRAGASFGLGMLLIIIVAHLVKYCAFRAGSDYAAVTGKSLLYAYKRQGVWSLYLYALVTLSSMFIVLAAVTLVSAGLFRVVFGVSANSSTVATAIVFCSAALLIKGQYRWLEKVTKVLIAVLTIITLVTTVLAVPQLDWSQSAQLFPPVWDTKTLLFTIALAGWMPTALDTSVWQSVWTVEKARAQGGVSPAQSRWDFNIGYTTTMILAICFLLIGASIMHGSGTVFSATASGFAAQFIDVYAQTLGEWSRPVIGVTAVAVMLSTVITVLDGFPRAGAKWWVIMFQRAMHDDDQADDQAEDRALEQRWYVRLVVVQSIGALSIIFFWLSSFKLLVDIAATISFVMTPILAYLNHRAMCDRLVLPAYRLRGVSYWASVVSIVLLSVFSLSYFYLLVAS
jgi:Mn2+/Fe2+ NRAMP family transporter